MALLCAQAFGIGRGYWCDCAGIVEWTVQDHCHGPHAEACHDDDLTSLGHQESDELGSRRDHQQIRDDVQSRLTSTLEAPALVPLLVAVIEPEFSLPLPAAVWNSGVGEKWTRGSPPGVVVARTVVFLI